MHNEKKDNVIKILWAVCVIPIIIGIILLSISTEKNVYSTDEYWVAQGYRHVYERYSGEIVDYIESNESCKIDGNKIIVTKHSAGYGWGIGLIVFFGLGTIGLIWGTVSTSDWWREWREKHNF